jgi:tRNA G10  N-methylase Trm11
MNFLVFGNHPRLSLAEFSCINPNVSRPIICGKAALVQTTDWDGSVLMNRLGGTVKLGEIVGELPLNDLEASAVAELLQPRLQTPSLDFGWTVFGGSKAAQQRLAKLAMKFKRELKERGVASRWVTGEHNQELSPAAVAKLKLIDQGLDVCLFVSGETVHVGRTTDVQDATAWSDRDYGRPARDDVNGMLPPKLARIMVNLAKASHGSTLVDPFCGGGTVLMEAALATEAGKLVGSDLEAKQIADSKKNQDWLIGMHILRPNDASRFQYILSDVKTLGRHLATKSIDRIVTEGYLGPPLHGRERREDLERNASQISELWKAALLALRPLLRPNARLVVIWPAFKTEHGMARVDLTPALSELGYALIDPLAGWEEQPGPFIYTRPGQFIARRVAILETVA